MNQTPSTRHDDDTDTTLVGRAGDLAGRAQDRLRAGLHDSRATLMALQDTTLARARAAGQAADEVVHDNPWRAIGIAAAVGLLLGMLLRRS